MSAFFAMGGYAAFIWPAYAVSVLVMAGLAAQSALDLRTQRRLVNELEAGERARPRAPARGASPIP